MKRQKNDAADAEAICEAVTQPTMRFVEVKTPEQQSVMVLHKVRLTMNYVCSAICLAGTVHWNLPRIRLHVRLPAGGPMPSMG